MTIIPSEVDLMQNVYRLAIKIFHDSELSILSTIQEVGPSQPLKRFACML